MDSGNRDIPTSDQSRKELSISLAASSMINASDTITQEAYKANLKRIQEVKEVVRMLEINNEAAHKNFLVDQLEKRVMDGREAEDTLARLRNQPRLPEVDQFTNDVASDRSAVLLPTTATLVEVPESHSYPSYSSPAPTTSSYLSQTTQHSSTAKHQWSLPPQAHQAQLYNPNVFPYYQHHQHSAVPHSQGPVDSGQMGWHTMQSVPPQSRAYNPLAHQTSLPPTQVQQLNSYSQVTSLPLADALPGASNTEYIKFQSLAVGATASGYPSTAGWTRIGPSHSVLGTTPPNSTYCEPGFLAQSTTLRTPVTTSSEPQKSLSLPSTFQAQVPLQGIPAGQLKIPSSHPPPTLSYPKPTGSQSQPVSIACSKQDSISEFQQSHRLLQQLQQPSQQPQPQFQRHPQLLPEPQQSQPLPQPLLQPQPPQQSQVLLSSQRPLQPLHSQPRVFPQSTDSMPSASVSQPQNQSSQQPSQPDIAQEQARQRELQLRRNQASFIKAFQIVVQCGPSRLKTFWHHAKTSGISNEWFNAAIDSLPPGVWQSVMAQVNQSGPTLDAPPLESVPQQQVSARPSTNVPVTSISPPLTVMPLVQATRTTQQVTVSGTPTEGRSTHVASGQISELYAAQLRYYAERAAQSTRSATQATGNSATPPANIALMPTTVSIPGRNMSPAQTNVRTPKDANRSTLARDILRSLGKMVPKYHQEAGGTQTERINDYEGNKLPEGTPSQPAFHVATTKTPGVSPATSFVATNSPSMPFAKPNVQDQPQSVAGRSPSTAKSALEEAHEQAAIIEGPITIDLTLEDSDESMDGKRQNPVSPIPTAASAATSSQPVSPINTTNHTPLLESLSLEEPLINVASDGGTVDVHMHSPSLSLGAEASMDSNLVSPAPGSSKPVFPDLKQLPREASVHPPDGRPPLFLPSPPVSPVDTEPPETDPEMFHDPGETRSFLKRRSVDVDAMGTDTGLVATHTRKRRKQQAYVLIPPAPPHVKKAIKKMKEHPMVEGIDSDSEEVGEDEELQYSHLEQLLIEESKSRLLERQCWWLNCRAILNCAANLLAHLRNHAREEDLQAQFICRWRGCQKQFGMEQERDAHLESHTMRPLPCPFSGCDEQFDRPVEVMQHEMQHQTDRTEPLIRKPTWQPIVPTIPARLGAPPQRLPSYRVISRRVVKCQMSAERHAIVGPWVLWNIFSPIDLNMRKQNASMRSRPTRQSINYDMDSLDARRDDYDFLLALSSYPAKRAQLDDLDSNLITMSAARGLTLWGSGSAVKDTAGSATPEQYANAVSVTLAVDAAVPSSVTEETSTVRGNSEPEKRQLGLTAAGEEGTVERMLVL